MIYSINTFALSRQNNQESSALHGNVLKMIGNADVAQLGLSEAFVNQYEAHLAKLTDQVYVSSGSANTQLMKEADARRDKIFSRVHSKLQFAVLAEDDHELRKLGDLVQSEFLSKYNGRVPQLPYQEETAVLKGFLFDLRDKLTADERTLLAIATDIEKLEQANNDFQQAYLARNDERADAVQLEKTAGIRLALADDFAQLCLVVQFWANSDDASANAKREACRSFVGKLNTLLADALARIRQRRKGVDDEEGGGGSTSGSGSGTGGDDGNTGGTSGSDGTSGSGSNTGSTSGSTSGTDTGSDSGSGSGSNTGGSTNSNPHEIHDGVTEW